MGAVESDSAQLLHDKKHAQVPAATAALAAVRGSIDEIRRVDISLVDGVRRDPAKIGRLFRSLARNESTSATVAAIDEASATLRRFADRIDTKKCGAPAVLAVITGNGFGYVRPDGVAVIPIGGLGP